MELTLVNIIKPRDAFQKSPETDRRTDGRTDTQQDACTCISGTDPSKHFSLHDVNVCFMKTNAASANAYAP